MCSFVFFFKQKTAYEMRISDWSSDVCSSDLRKIRVEIEQLPLIVRIGLVAIVDRDRAPATAGDRPIAAQFEILHLPAGRPSAAHRGQEGAARDRDLGHALDHRIEPYAGRGQQGRRDRSDEHTSDLNTLMRI